MRKTNLLKTEDVIENISIASNCNVEYGSVFQNRYNAPIQFTKNIINNNSLGDIVSSSVQLNGVVNKTTMKMIGMAPGKVMEA